MSSVKIPVSRITARGHSTSGAAGAVAVDGRRVRWAAHRAARRDELIDSVIEAVTTHGTDVGMDQIAAVARTSKPVIYRYFADKNDLYGAVGTKVITRIVASLPEAEQHARPRDIFAAWVDAYLGFLAESPELYHFISRHQPAKDETETREDAAADPNRLMAAAIGVQLAHGLELIGLNPELAHPWGEATLGFVRSAGLWWIDHPGTMTRAELTDYLTTLLWDGAASIYGSGGVADNVPQPFRQRIT